MLTVHAASRQNSIIDVRFGQKQTSQHVRPMSALPLKADIETQPRDVRFVPKADIFGRLYSIIRCQPPQGSQSKKFRISVEKLPDSRRGIGAMASRISDMGIKPGAIMTIAEYLAATVLIALIVWAALGLLMQES
jgi:hypothetical protein